MKASELVTRLQEAIAKHGDLIVVDAWDMREITDVNFGSSYFHNGEEQDLFFLSDENMEEE